MTSHSNQETGDTYLKEVGARLVEKRRSWVVLDRRCRVGRFSILVGGASSVDTVAMMMTMARNEVLVVADGRMVSQCTYLNGTVSRWSKALVMVGQLTFRS